MWPRLFADDDVPQGCKIGGVAYRVGIAWLNHEDQGVLLTFSVNALLAFFSLFAYHVFAHLPSLKAVFAPRVPLEQGPPPHPLHISRGLSGPHEGEQLEATMLRRFLIMNLTLFCVFAATAMPALILTYSIDPYAGLDIPFAPPPPPPQNPFPPPALGGAAPPAPPGKPPLSPVVPWLSGAPISGIQSFSLAHLPPGSPRFWAPAACMLLLTSVFLILARREAEVYARLRYDWLAAPRPHLHAARLVTSHSLNGAVAPAVTAEDVYALLKPMFGADLHEVIKVPREVNQWRLSALGLQPPSLQAGGGADVPLLTQSGRSSWSMAAVWSLVVDLAHEMRLLATGEPREAAPARGEGLPEPCRSRRVGEATETSFISLASLDSITKMLQEAHLKGAAGMIHNLSPATRATLEGWMPVLVLTVLQMLTLYSGLLPALSRLQRRESAAAGAREGVLVLLGSCVVGSLFETAKLILSGGYCTLLALLGRSVLPLSVVGAARLCGARGKALSGKALSALQRLYYPSIYARALMVLSAAFLFATIAPLITLVTIAWLYAVSRAWSFNVRRVYLHDLGADFDSGGAYWPVAMRLETFALLTAQLVLVAIHVLNSCWYSGTVLFGLMIATMVRASRLQRHYSPLASELPLERCIKVDASMAGDTSPGAQAYQLDWILAEASRAYRTSFENSSFRSGDLLAGGQ
ncbi:hypothetical protein EMIHUDRAFT_210867 [Emiliania huxleyi CCMP1516]|uniref:CSC1/OSCA1-like 7TM region domain-containing protein n=2 Tax=Emiliania huxleyi TaxID=2903 RepID=A0A0D3IXE9_EMIH1|nr:hypothetical protein EMIHUDRAFT_210867 [Emiliania huxleyi CCMP1516]EOD15934.1 hypothetical protein EMIHUDRAFT_210867 [Emiliania huxleyi CCMP1516]|eukprot:XP_005768363.1 hypothetical protein EMIHUDRAFT_210867 [Emiliania huxleyi CCMP1516]